MIDRNDDFGEYFETYYSQIYRYILKRIGDDTQAEDLAMDCFLACYMNYESYDSSKASFATWLYVIVNNKLKNYFRDHKMYEELCEEQASPEIMEDEVIQAAYLDDMRTKLAISLKSLPSNQLKIVLLKYFSNKNSTEIARILGLTPGNVRVQLNRALKKLKKFFDDNNWR